MVKIISISPGSPAAKAGIKPGNLLSINGNDINDVLDLQFYGADKLCEVAVETDGNIYTYSITKPDYADLGFEFETYLIDCERSCTNSCVFCFIDQNPKGMRESIYFKDDDSRLSFLQGNYITLTNLSEADIDRIIKMKMSVNVSLHTMNPALREKMMRNRFAARGIDYLKRLLTAGIDVNIQLVLCPGLNDGAELEFTLSELVKIGGFQSIAAVPVGLTKYREGLYPLEPFNKAAAGAVIDTIETFGQQNRELCNERLIYASDEFFLIAGREIPAADYYEDYPQYENGVGMLRSFTDEFLAAMDDFSENAETGAENTKTGTENAGTGTDSMTHPGAPVYSVIATGESSYNTVSGLCKKAAQRFPHIHADVIKVKNNFFGGHVTVTGLLTGSDIITALKDRELKGRLLLALDMFKKDTELFLDDLTLSDVEKALNIKALKFKRDGYELFDAIKE